MAKPKLTFLRGIRKRSATPETIFIVGAGFSAGAGLPLASGFTKALVDVETLKETGSSPGLVELIRHFVKVSFAHGPTAEAKYWPELEDVFTCIDLSANSGHHLGPKYSPADLRTVRRALLVRMIRMLPQKYKKAGAARSAEWKQLEAFFEAVDPRTSAFLSMNWDVVIEHGLEDAHGVKAFDYGCDAIPMTFGSRELVSADPDGSPARILKPHGSINWLYCDACRRLFYVPPDQKQTDKVAGQLFRERDWARVEEIVGAGREAADPVNCPRCEADALGTRFATFSYRKALDFPMHAKTWQSAERLLYAAKNWVFIGYSLPPADFEFKQLLKRVQLTRRPPPVIHLVTGGDPKAAEATRANYQKFFGPALKASNARVFLKGLNAAALKGLRAQGCLAPPPAAKVSRP